MWTAGILKWSKYILALFPKYLDTCGRSLNMDLFGNRPADLNSIASNSYNGQIHTNSPSEHLMIAIWFWLVPRNPFLEALSNYRACLAVLFSIPDGSFKSFENYTVKLSAKETKWTSLEVRTHPTFLETMISKYDFRSVKLLGLLRNGPQIPLLKTMMNGIWNQFFLITYLHCLISLAVFLGYLAAIIL